LFVMIEEPPEDDWQRQIDELRTTVDRYRADLERLEARASEVERRADVQAVLSEAADRRATAHQQRADLADARAEASEARSAGDQVRLTNLEARLTINDRILSELLMEGLINHEQADHLQDALRTSRRIGAAIGLVMAADKVSEQEAFAILSRRSQDTNVKVRVLADEIVTSGDANLIPEA
jgi:chromosome segregation ATPase